MKTKPIPAVWRTVGFGRHMGSVRITFILLILTVCLSACTSMRPVADDAETLQQRIRAGQVIRQGDYVRVVTRDSVSHMLTVVSVEGDVLKGRLDTKAPAGTGELGAKKTDKEQGEVVEISISDIVFVEEKKFSVAKTAGAIGGGTVVLLSALVVIALLAW
jgi:hypothetical protein